MARPHKGEPPELIEEDKPTDVEGLIAFLDKLRAGIPEDQRISWDDILNLDEILYSRKAIFGE